MLIKCTSHRAHDKVEKTLGYKPKEYYHLYKNYHLVEVPDDLVEYLLKFKGIVQAPKDTSGWRECWKRPSPT